MVQTCLLQLGEVPGGCDGAERLVAHRGHLLRPELGDLDRVVIGVRARHGCLSLLSGWSESRNRAPLPATGFPPMDEGRPGPAQERSENTGHVVTIRAPPWGESSMATVPPCARTSPLTR